MSIIKKKKHGREIEEAAMKLGCWGEKPVKKSYIAFRRRKRCICITVYTNNNYVGSNFDSVNFFFHIIILAINFFNI